jgi:hypothetical protein
LRRALLALAAAACVAAVSGCGEDTEAAPHGSPVERHGEQAVATVQQIEQIRARLVAAADLYGLRQAGDARLHLRVAQSRWAELEPRVEPEDAVLAREMSAGFERIDRLMADRATFDSVRDLLSPLSDQLLGGVTAALLDQDATADRGLQAEVTRRIVTEMAGTFAQGTRPGDDPARRTSLQYSYGLMARAQAIARGLSKSLGAEKDDVTNTLSNVRERNFPDGLDHPQPKPAEAMSAAAARITAALARRYDLHA